eukprot:1208393-Prymnesium_polylepis.1
MFNYSSIATAAQLELPALFTCALTGRSSYANIASRCSHAVWTLVSQCVCTLHLPHANAQHSLQCGPLFPIFRAVSRGPA